MSKPFIKLIRVFINNECVASVDDGNGFTTQFEAPNEVLKDLNLYQRYAYMEDRAERYMKCIEVDSEPADIVEDLPFPEKLVIHNT